MSASSEQSRPTSHNASVIALSEDQGRLVRDILESVSHPVYVVDVEDYGVVLANSAAGFSQAPKGTPCYALSHDRDTPCGTGEHACPVHAVRQSSEPATVEHTHIGADGKRRHVEVRGYPLLNAQGEVHQVVIYALDITERRLLETRLSQRQKLELVGRLAGGVAHDFNNILSAILGYAETAMLKLPLEHPVRNDLQVIADAGRRGGNLVRHLLTFSHGEPLERRAIDLNTVVNSVGRTLLPLLGEDIELALSTATTAAVLEADRGQLEQVLLNLAINARDAMPLGGTLAISTQLQDLDGVAANQLGVCEPGTYVVLEVRDSGEGMPAEVQKHIFEPFYTTKRHSGGNGLGLATVYGVVRKHRGHIVVESEPGHGATFRLLFPCSANVAEQEPLPASPIARGGNERVMVVEDEAVVRDLLEMVLKELGYEVLTASNAEAALALTAERSVELLITDVVMPGMSGTELAARLCSGNPALRVLLTSGYAREQVLGADLALENWAFVQKPMTPAVLAAEVRRLLDYP